MRAEATQHHDDGAPTEVVPQPETARTPTMTAMHVPWMVLGLVLVSLGLLAAMAMGFQFVPDPTGPQMLP